MDAEKIIQALQNIADDKNRFIVSENNSFSCNVVNEELNDVQESSDVEVKIDLIRDKKRGTNIVDCRDFDFVKKQIRSVENLLTLKDIPFYDTFPEYDVITNKKILDLDLMKFSRKNLDGVLPDLIELNNSLLKHQHITSLKSDLELSLTKKTFISGDDLFEDHFLNFALFCEASVKNKTESTTDISRDFFTIDSFDLNAFKSDLLNKIEFEKDPVCDISVDSREYDLIFSPETFSDLISAFIIDQIDIEHYSKKDNFIYTGAKFDEKLNIVEETSTPYSFYSALRDDDFVPAKNKSLVSAGKVEGYLSNLDKAFKYAAESTGNQLSGTVTNIFVNSGKEKYFDLINKTKKGLVITELLGLHTTNSNEGALNLTASSCVEIIGGNKKRVLKNVQINDSFVSLMRNIDLSSESVWHSNFNLPYLFCRRNY